MFIRCARCHGAVWIEPAAGDGPAESDCQRCGQSYRVKIRGGIQAARTLNLRARRFAVEHAIDLPAACSVIIGSMTIEQVRDVCSGGATVFDTTAPPAAEETPQAPAGGAPAVPPFDRDFLGAVEAGLLTPRQAFERGSREAFARRLMARHDLTEDRAFDVADNRISLLAALRMRDVDDKPRAREDIDVGVGPEREATPRRRTSPVTAGLVAAVAVVVALIGVAWLVMGNGETPGGTDTLEVKTDAAGRVVLIEAPEAEAVLDAFCQSSGGSEPLGLMPSAFGASRVRVGILRDAAGGEKLLAIPIRRERDGTRWSTGDGQRPIVAMQAPEDAAGVFAKNP